MILAVECLANISKLQCHISQLNKMKEKIFKKSHDMFNHTVIKLSRIEA